MRALPRSKLLRFRFLGTPQRHRLSWVCVLCPSLVRAAQATRCWASTPSPSRWCILSLPSSQLLCFLGVQQERHLRCAMCLLWGADLWLRPSWWMSIVQDPGKTSVSNWELARSFVEDAVSGAEIAPFWLWLSPACLSASGGGWAGLQPASSPLVFTQSFVL